MKYLRRPQDVLLDKRQIVFIFTLVFGPCPAVLTAFYCWDLGITWDSRIQSELAACKASASSTTFLFIYNSILVLILSSPCEMEVEEKDTKCSSAGLRPQGEDAEEARGDVNVPEKKHPAQKCVLLAVLLSLKYNNIKFRYVVVG